MPRLMQFADEMPGVPIQDDWDDIGPVSGSEDLGFPTQKPLPLLERIVRSSSNPGDILLDPFCGCGTAIVAAQKLGRRWIGIDVATIAISIMEDRLKSTFGIGSVDVRGRPRDVEGARRLATRDSNGRHEFEWWVLQDLLHAWPEGKPKQKGADRGIDCRITFTPDREGTLESILVSIKSGAVGVSMIRDLRGTIEREGAAMGLFITLEEPTPPMLQEAREAGQYRLPLLNRSYPRIQVLSIREILEEHRQPHLPPYVFQGGRRAGRIPDLEQAGLFGQLAPEDRAAPAEPSKPKKRRAAAG
jgi:hypothetical protein